MSVVKEAVVQRLKSICKDRGIAANELANLSGVTPSTEAEETANKLFNSLGLGGGSDTSTENNTSTKLETHKKQVTEVKEAYEDWDKVMDDLAKSIPNLTEKEKKHQKQEEFWKPLISSTEELFGNSLAQMDAEEEEFFKNEERRIKETQAIREASLNSATMLLDNYKDYLDKSYDEEMQMAEGNEKKQYEIKKRYAKQKFLTQIASIGISTAQAIMATWAAFAEVPIAAAIQSAAIGALGIAQTAQAQKEMNKALKAERGGILGGQSHANGGTMLSNGVEAERGEAIINKRSTAAFAPLLSEINSYNGYGAPLISSTPSTSSALQSTVSDETIQRIVSATVQGIASIPVVVSEHAITEAQRTVGITRERSFI